MVAIESMWILGLVLASQATPSLPLTVRSPADGAARPRAMSSSALLVQAQSQQHAGDHAGAGHTFRQALEALSEHKQRADEGANAALLSAEAHWRAFVEDSEATHLQDGIDVLELWLERAGPGSRSSKLPEVYRAIARLRAIHEPLVAETHAPVRAPGGETNPGAEESENSTAETETQPPAPQSNEPSPPPGPPPAPTQIPPSRGVAIALLSLGVAATGAGAAMVGEAAVFHRVASREVDRLSTLAEAGPPHAYEHDMGLVRAYEDEATRRYSSLLVGGSVLAASGLTMIVSGAILERRRTRGTRRNHEVQPVASLSRSGASLSIVTRF